MSVQLSRRSILEEATRLGPSLVDWRRNLHRIPEPGFGEFQTVAYLLDRLAELPARVRYGNDAQRRDSIFSRNEDLIGVARDDAIAKGVDKALIGRLDTEGTGVIAELGQGSPVIGIRVDMDGLPIDEATEGHGPSELGFTSERVGFMHACGHDGHMSLGLGVLSVLARHASQLPGTVRIVFQPAEEGTRGGAASMVAAGAMDDVDHFIAVHLGLGVPSGSIAPAAQFMATTKMRITFQGRAAHVTNEPQAGANALLAGASSALDLHSIAPSSQGWFSVNVGVMKAGTEQGITPATATLEAGFWADEDVVHDYLLNEVQRMVAANAAARDCVSTIERIGAAPSARPDEEVAAVVARAAEDANAADVLSTTTRIRAGEDASEFMKAVQRRNGNATFVIIGSAFGGGHHTPTFDFDETVLPLGLCTLTGAVARLLGLADGWVVARTTSGLQFVRSVRLGISR